MCLLFNGAFRRSDVIALNDRMINVGEWGRKISVLNLRQYAGIFLEELRKTVRNVRIADLQAEI